MIYIILTAVLVLALIVVLGFLYTFQDIQRNSSKFEPDFSSIRFTKPKCDCV